MENNTKVNIKKTNIQKSKQIEYIFEDLDKKSDTSRNLLSLILEFLNIKELSDYSEC